MTTQHDVRLSPLFATTKRFGRLILTTDGFYKHGQQGETREGKNIPPESENIEQTCIE
jgi:hypothetical protein